MITFRLAILPAALLATLTFNCPGDETLTFVTTTGRLFRNVELTKVEKTGIVVTNSSGIIRLEFEILPEDMRKKYGYDPAVAAAERERLSRERAVPLFDKEFQEAFEQGMREELERQKKNARTDGGIIARKVIFASKILNSGSEPKTEFEKARYQYAREIDERFSRPVPRAKSFEEFKRERQSAKADDPTEEDIPAHLLSEEAFNEWKKAKVNSKGEGTRPR
jgi:hypothetical protein